MLGAFHLHAMRHKANASNARYVQRQMEEMLRDSKKVKQQVIDRHMDVVTPLVEYITSEVRARFR
jgi:hypothetical protein